jgi:hypothetical protein
MIIHANVNLLAWNVTVILEFSYIRTNSVYVGLEINMWVFFFRNHNTEQNYNARIGNNAIGIIRAEENSNTDVIQCSF